MIDSPVVDLPQPDSPTSPTHSPSATVNETPSTAFTFAERRWNSVLEVLDLENDALSATAPSLTDSEYSAARSIRRSYPLLVRR